jgi:hypothetical protein
MKVYIVEYPVDFLEQESGGIQAVFTTEELAQDYIKDYIKNHPYENLFYDEYEVKEKL